MSFDISAHVPEYLQLKSELERQQPLVEQVEQKEKEITYLKEINPLLKKPE